MRKIFASLKAVVAAALVASMTLAASCSYDDSAINNRVNKVEEELAALTERVKALESHAEAVKELLDGALVVTNVETKDGVTTVTLSDGTKITVYGECDTLQYRVNEGVLEVSADGQNWVAVEQTADCVIKAVVVNEDNTVTFTLADDTEFTVALAELIECEAARTGVYVLPGATKEIVFTVNDAVVDMNIMNQPFGWSATVGEPTVEEENGGIAPFAAGGTDYALKITGPSQALVDAGYAAKEGVVSVHFNTASGACKVLSVNVNLAEISLSIDKAGNITLTNTVALEQTNRFGETRTDFADFSIGIIDANDEAYLEYGDDVFVETYNPMLQEYDANINQTLRNSGFSNVIDLVMYEEGVCEMESYTFAPEQLAGAFWPRYNFEVGGEYIIFVTLETEQVNYAIQPVLTNAIKVTYKNVKVGAEFVRSTWNGAEYDLSLLGYTHYIIGWVNAMELDNYIQMGVVSSLEDYLILSTADMGGNISVLPGTLIAGDHDGVYSLADLRAQSLTGWAPEIASNSEYYLYIYPFNFQSEMDLYAPVDPANIYSFGKFATSGLEAGEFEAGEEVKIKEHTEDLFSVIVTFNENVVAAGASFGSTPALNPDDIVDEIVSNPYGGIFTFNEEVDYLEVYTNDVTDPLYMYIVAINANGEYVFIEKEYSLKGEGGEGGEGGDEPTLEQVAITEFKYVARSYELDDNPETGGGDFVYDFTCADGTSYRMGLFYGYANADGSIKNGTYTYCTNNLNYMYTGWEGFAIVSDTYYYDSTLTVTPETITWLIPGVVEYVYTFAEGEGNEDEVLPNCENLTLYLSTAEGYTSVGIGGYGDIRLVDAEGKNYVNIEINDQPVCTKLYTYDGENNTDPGTLYCGNCYVNYAGAGPLTATSPRWTVGSTVNVVVEGDVCTITLNLTLSDGNKFSGVYTGALPF